MTSARSVFVAIALAALGCTAIGLVQPELAHGIRKVHERDDAFYLPPPTNLKAMSLGYRAAATDLLWALLILENGQHWVDHLKFTTVDKYVDEIIEMEPDYKNIYLYVDTLVLYVYGGAGESEARAVRAYLERGIAERPGDPEIWLHAGQSVAFFLPSYLKDEAEIQRFRADGAKMILHAVELGASADRSLAATTILMNQGEKEAIEREAQIYALTDDPEARRQILGKLQRYKGDFGPTLAIDAIEREWRENWPILTRGEALLVGPPRAPAACAGPQSFGERECPRDWNDYVQGMR